MGKKSKRRREEKVKRAAVGKLPPSPSAPTVFRIALANRDTRKLLEQMTAMASPQVLLRDQNKIKQIKEAKTPVELLDLAHIATGLAETPWQERTLDFGEAIVPLMAERLKNSPAITDEDQRTYVVERIVAALRWHGQAGATALQESFTYFDLWGKALASVVLGLLGASDSANLIWDYYQTVRERTDSLLIGALWGLVDLKDVRASGALVDLLVSTRRFYELYGFLALVGDARAVAPLGMVASNKARPKSDREGASMALIAVGHRIGREALVEEIGRAASLADTRELIDKTVDQVFSYSDEAVENYFDLFFHGFTPEQALEAMKG